jgi:hypothetical protein
MVLSEIFSTSFLFSITIIIIVIGGLFAYFNHRLAVQNHKISSMMGLVTTMAEEMQYFRSKLSGKSQENYCKMPDADLIHIVPQFLGGNTSNLIEVSDGESDEETEDEEESDEDEDSESDEEESENDDEESDDESESDEELEELDELESESKDLEEENIKNINISIDLGDAIDLNIEQEVIDCDTKTISLSEDISSFEITSKSLENIDDIDIGIKLTNDYAEKDKTDYKKLSLNKLREIVIEKGLVVDASKLKKNDILKMLGAEQ